MEPKNYYPELPIIPFKKTSIDMNVVIEHANSLTTYPTEVKRMAYCMFRNESANGSKGVNNNYAGIQADCGRWSGLMNAIGTCVRVDSGGINRRFICFGDEGYKDTFNFLCFKIQSRGMYIGALGVNDIKSLTSIYLKKWVGRINSTPNSVELFNWSNLYGKAKLLIK